MCARSGGFAAYVKIGFANENQEKLRATIIKIESTTSATQKLALKYLLGSMCPDIATCQ
jgi:hypothetical protein